VVEKLKIMINIMHLYPELINYSEKGYLTPLESACLTVCSKSVKILLNFGGVVFLFLINLFILFLTELDTWITNGSN
jgi:hypothetical protein